MRASKITEKKLAKHLASLLPQIGLELLECEVTLGKFRLDAVARDRAGSLVVVELKTKARLETLAQLLLYPHALAKFARSHAEASPSVHAVLITTHLDQNVVEVVDLVESPYRIDLWVCVGRKPSEFRLVPPSEAGDQCWDQTEEGSVSRVEAIRDHLL